MKQIMVIVFSLFVFYIDAMVKQDSQVQKKHALWQMDKIFFHLFDAAKKNDIELLRKFLESGGNPSAKLGSYSLLMDAAEYGRKDFIELLLKHGAEVNTGYSKTVLGHAIWNGHYECAKILIEHGAKINYLVFDQAQDKHIKCLELLFDQQIDFKKTFVWGFLENEDGGRECIKLCIQKGASINTMDSLGSTPLKLATVKGKTDCVQLLLDHGARVNVIGDPYQYRALHEAAHRGFIDIVKLLIQAGADLKAKTKSTAFLKIKEETAKDLAHDDGWIKENKDTLIELLESFEKEISSLKLLCMRFIVKNKLDVNQLPTELQRSIDCIREDE